MLLTDVVDVDQNRRSEQENSGRLFSFSGGLQVEPTTTDRELASELARAIVSLGHESVRQVVMIGSRAEGRARPGSDLDLVVVIELAPGVKPWGGEDFARSRAELQSALGRHAVPVDVRVRTTDRYAEARNVPGGVEWQATHSGVIVFEIPPLRAPVVRTPPENVRRELVSSWMSHAVSAIEKFGESPITHSHRDLANTAIERLIAAVLTHEGVAPQLDRNLTRYAVQIPKESIRRTLEEVIKRVHVAPRASAIEGARRVLNHVQQDSRQRRYLTRFTERLQRISSSADS